MKLTAKIKLNPTEYQHDVLLRTLEQANHVSNGISEFAFREKVFNKIAIQKRICYEVRERSNLSTQMTIRAISNVADAYKLDKKTRCRFKRYDAIAYDSRILKYKTEQSVVSIWTIEGRQAIPCQAASPQHDLLKYQQGESDLVYRGGEFYLYATCDVPEEEQMTVEQFLGVDLGIVNIAADNDGETFNCSHVNKVRHRNRARVKKPQRTALNSWAFYNLGVKIIYKAIAQVFRLFLLTLPIRPKYAPVVGMSLNRIAKHAITFAVSNVAMLRQRTQWALST